MNYATDFKSIRGQVSAEEWQARVDLAACYRLVDKYGMTDLIYNHITARIPGSEDHLLINLYGMLYKEITASSLVKIDVEGEIIWKPDTDYGINKSGYVIHGAIHKARPDVACVLHTHTRAGIAVSAMTCGLLPLSQTSIRFVGHIGYHDYEGPAVDLDERERIVDDLGPHDALIMRNHGLLTCGATIQQAFNTMYQLELSCRSQVDAMAARTELTMPGENVLAHTAHLYQPGHAPSLRRAGMAGDAAPARRRGPQLRLSAVLELSDRGRAGEFLHPEMRARSPIPIMTCLSSHPTALTFPYPAPPEPGRPTEIAPGILWLRLALPYRLDHVNVYLIEDGAGWAVLDTGLDDATTRAAWETLLAGPLRGRPLTRVLVTHYHPDHIGLAGWLCERFGLPLLMSQTEYLVSLSIHLEPGALNAEPYRSFYRSHGLDSETTERLLTSGHRYLRMISGLPRTFRRLIAGELLRIGGRTFEVLSGGGHAPEQVMLFCPADNLLLCADQVLARISPNISVQAMDPEGDPLGIYLRSLASLKRDMPEDVAGAAGAQSAVRRPAHPHRRALRAP